MIDHAPSSLSPNAHRSAPYGCARRRAIVIAFALTSAMVVGAIAQPGYPPQPAPRPREATQAPATQPAPVAPTIAPAPLEPPASAHAAPRSRQQLRSLQRACAQEWSRRKAAGQTMGQIWVDFFEACSERL